MSTIYVTQLFHLCTGSCSRHWKLSQETHLASPVQRRRLELAHTDRLDRAIVLELFQHLHNVLNLVIRVEASDREAVDAPVLAENVERLGDLFLDERLELYNGDRGEVVDTAFEDDGDFV